MKYKHLGYGIQSPQERNSLVLEERIGWKQETRETIIRREGYSNKRWRKRNNTRASSSRARTTNVIVTVTEHQIVGVIKIK